MINILKSIKPRLIFEIIFIVCTISVLIFIIKEDNKRFDKIEKLLSDKQSSQMTIETVDVSKINENKYEIEEEFVLEEEQFNKDAFLFSKAATISKSIHDTIIAETAVEKSQKYNIPLFVIYTFIETESSFKKDVNSKAGSKYGRGLMQISEVALKEYNIRNNTSITTQQLYNINMNLEIGCWTINHIMNYYNRHTKLDLSWQDIYIAYNVGWRNFLRYKDDYYNNINIPHNNVDYNALKRFNKFYDFYSSYFYYEV